MAGTSTAILGPSGSGKTTLLNYLSSRMSSSSLTVNGELLLNGRKINSIKDMKHRFSYVMQDDVLYEDLTVKEHIYSTAQIIGDPDPTKTLNQILKWLNLEKCQNTKAGSHINRGISGGEKKRTSIGLELVTDPSVIFLDEPTTGLDSKSALDVAGLMKMFAKKGRTVIATIHQPSSDIMNKFDQVMCLCKGEIVYYGPPSEIRSHFEGIGYAPLPHSNPTDHLMSILNDDDIRIKAFEEGRSISEEQVKEEFLERLDLFVNTYESKKRINKIAPCSEETFNEIKRDHRIQKTMTTICVLLKRFILFFLRNPQGFVAKVAGFIGIALINVILYVKMRKVDEDTLGALQDMNGLMFAFVLSTAFAAISGSLYGIIPMIPMFVREKEKRLYSSTTFYLLSSSYQIPLFFILLGLYLLASLLLLDINRGDDWEYTPKWYLALLVVYISGMGVGDFVSVLLRDIELANQLVPIFMIPLFMVSGYIAIVKEMVFFIVGYSYISPFRFGYQVAMIIQYDKKMLTKFMTDCTIRIPGCYSDEPKCFVKSPNNGACSPALYLDFIETDYWTNIYILLALVVGYRVLSAVTFSIAMREVKAITGPIPSANTLDEKQRKRIGQSSTVKDSKFRDNTNEQKDEKLNLAEKKEHM